MATKDPEKLDPSGANEGRERRAELIKAANEADVAAAKAEQKAADAASKPVKEPKTTKTTTGGRQVKAKRTQPTRTAPRHVVKQDDAGAREQQRAARENSADIQLADLEGPPIVAPVLDEGLKGKFEIVRNDGSGDKVKEALYAGLDLRVVGEGFPHPGEVIIDVAKEDGQDHQRFSAYTYDGTIDLGLMGISGPGTWLFNAESPVTQVGDGRDDHLPVIRVGKEQKLVVK